jgi:hypothetical protein
VLATGEILGQTKAVSDVMSIELSAVKRVIDIQILDINKIDGSYNGAYTDFTYFWAYWGTRGCGARV